MNRVLIFAGGTGQRMGPSAMPKQFLIVHGKPIIVHTILHFQNCRQIDSIVVVCLKDYIGYMRELISEYGLNKVVSVVEGGDCGQASIFNGLKELARLYGDKNEDIVLVHDGVRPLIDEKLIVDNIECAHKNGNAVTVSKAIETVITAEDGNITAIEDRSSCYYAKAPQSFRFNEIYGCHLKAIGEKKYDFIDSATMMQYYGHKLHTVLGSPDNIKITTQMDFFMFKGLLDALEINQMKVKL